jgi:alkylglycerol monooxygenase
MEFSYILLALPYFLFFIGLELWISHRQKRELYHIPDLISNLSCGLMQQMLMVFLRLPLLAIYVFVYEHRLLDLPFSGPFFWVGAFLFLDFVYYWWHRLSHEVSSLWVGHVVHHQSEHMNFSVGLRQDAFTNLTAFPFELVVALVGISPSLFLVMQAVATLYQFWIHTQLVGKLGPLEYILMTPSHHRVHHGTNPQYLDKNYGATFIFWDKLFGTFVKEGEAPVYGLTKPLRSFHPIWAQLQYWNELWRRLRIEQRLAVLFQSPAWREAESTPRGYRRSLSSRSWWVVGVCFVSAALLILSLLLFRPSLLGWERVLISVISILLFAVCGIVLEGLRLSLISLVGFSSRKL